MQQSESFVRGALLKFDNFYKVENYLQWRLESDPEAHVKENIPRVLGRRIQVAPINEYELQVMQIA